MKVEPFGLLGELVDDERKNGCGASFPEEGRGNGHGPACAIEGIEEENGAMGDFNART